MYVAMFHRGSKTIEVPCTTADDLICVETEYTSNGWECWGVDDLNEKDTADYLKRFGNGVHCLGV